MFFTITGLKNNGSLHLGPCYIGVPCIGVALYYLREICW